LPRSLFKVRGRSQIGLAPPPCLRYPDPAQTIPRLEVKDAVAGLGEADWTRKKA
jgi:hypothetical protein